MATYKKNIDETKDNSRLTFESDGIVFEDANLMQKDLKEKIDILQTKKVEKELFDAIGAEIPETVTEPKKPKPNKLKEELNRGGIELLQTEPLRDGEI